jgi:hypothetical protein
MRQIEVCDDRGVEAVRVRVLPDRRVTSADAGKIFDRSPKTMANWRSKGWGPRPIVVGGRVFHDYDECLEMARGEKPIVPSGPAEAA